MSQINPTPTFRISSALKNLIGKELITDELIAIFELVKNSFDAHAHKATILFENIYNNNSKITIIDDGKGMNYADIIDKWLFVAYSAKKEGTEDYRDKIKTKIAFAGAKGVGRFSCDRLGKHLNLISIKNEAGSAIENLEVDWEKFEENAQTEFINIKTKFRRLEKHPHTIKHGTILEITGLRDKWDKNRILKLKHSLEKLINPAKDSQAKNFQIEIICEEEKEADKKAKDERDKVNGLVRNTIFDKIETKTTKIESRISEDGKIITTTLTDRGSWIYTLKERNEYKSANELLHNICIDLFQLNRAAKISFTRDMGVEPVRYGSVFMYKNDFRIYPFGEEGDDSLAIDRRKQQGYSRFLGTRDLLGSIQIKGDNNTLIESTSRDGGLIKNDEYLQLVKYFYDKVFYRLENYVVDIIEWGDDRMFELEERINLPGLQPEDVKKEIKEYIKKLSKAKNIISIDYNKDLLAILEEKTGSSINKELRALAKKAKNRKDPEAYKQAVKLKQEFSKITTDTRKAAEKAEKSEKELEYTIGQNNFLQDSVKADTKDFQSLLHHTEKSTYWINKYIENLIKKIDEGAAKEKLFEIISSISLENQKIFSFTKYHKSTNFNTFVEKIDQDIVSFINEYTNNVCRYYDEYANLNITIKTPPNLSFKRSFSPVEIPIIIDNLLNNSKKAGASKITLTWEGITNKEIKLHVSDNGSGFDKSTIHRIFEFRFSTTKGSGIGLFHVRNLINGMGGSIEANPKSAKGAEFIITLNK